MVKPIPQNVKDVINQLTPAQKITISTYIAWLKEEIKELENKLPQEEVGDDHAHFHGHEKCTSDHDHGDHGHEPKEESHGHDHKDSDHHDHTDCDHHDHKETEQKSHDHSHGHGHDEKEPEKKSEHDHSHHEHKKAEDHEGSHDHGHKHHNEAVKADGELPAWKKAAMANNKSDPMAAPFGGSWNVESSMSASDKEKKMEE